MVQGQIAAFPIIPACQHHLLFKVENRTLVKPAHRLEGKSPQTPQSVCGVLWKNIAPKQGFLSIDLSGYQHSCRSILSPVLDNLHM